MMVPADIFSITDSGTGTGAGTTTATQSGTALGSSTQTETAFTDPETLPTQSSTQVAPSISSTSATFTDFSPTSTSTTPAVTSPTSTPSPTFPTPTTSSSSSLPSTLSSTQPTLTTKALSSSPAGTSASANVLSGGGQGVGSTQAPIGTKPFFKRTAAAAGVFTVVGLAALALVIVIYFKLIRHRRLQVIFVKVEKAARARMMTIPPTEPGNAVLESPRNDVDQQASSPDAHPQQSAQWLMEPPEPPPSYASPAPSYAGSEVDRSSSWAVMSETLATAAPSLPGSDTPVEKTLSH